MQWELRPKLAFLALLTVPGCIPIEADVSVSSRPQLTSAAAPLQPQEAIVILGTSAASDDGDIPACVREALSEVSPGTRIVEAKFFRAKVGGRLAQGNAVVKEEEIEAELQETAVQRAIVELAVRYLFFVKGETSERGSLSSSHSTTTGLLGGSSSRWTNINAAVWDAPEVHNIGSLSANSHAQLVHTVGILEYAPTESIACESLAGEIQRLLASRYTPGS